MVCEPMSIVGGADAVARRCFREAARDSSVGTSRIAGSFSTVSKVSLSTASLMLAVKALRVKMHESYGGI